PFSNQTYTRDFRPGRGLCLPRWGRSQTVRSVSGTAPGGAGRLSGKQLPAAQEASLDHTQLAHRTRKLFRGFRRSGFARIRRPRTDRVAGLPAALRIVGAPAVAHAGA